MVKKAAAGQTPENTKLPPDQAPMKRGPEGAKAVDRTARLLLELARHPKGIALAELGRKLGDPVPTIHRALTTLRPYDLVRETVQGTYAIGVSAVVLAGALAEGLDLRAEAGPVMTSLRDKTGETVHLGVLSGAQIVYIEKLDSPNAVRMVSRVGGTNPALTTAMGLSLLAASDRELVNRTVELSKLQYPGLITGEQIETMLTDTRTQGYGTDLEVNEVGICCVGAAIFDVTGHPIAGISVSTPTLRFDRGHVAELGETVKSAAAEISRRLGYRPLGSSPDNDV